MERKLVLAVFLIAFLPRLLFLNGLPPDLVVHPLSQVYLLKAAAPHGFDECVKPVYPILLAVTGFFSETLPAGRLLGVLLGSCFPVVVYFIARKLGEDSTAFYAGLFAAAHSLALYWSPYLLAEQVLLLTASLSVYCALSRRTRDIILSSLFAFVAAMTMDAGAAFILTLAVYVAFRDGSRMAFFYAAPVIAFALIAPLNIAVPQLSPENITHAMDVLAWSFTKERIAPSFPLFLLAAAGILAARARLISSLFVGAILLVPIVSSCGLNELTQYLPLAPLICVLAGFGFSLLRGRSRLLAYAMLLILAFQVLHFGLNYYQSLEMVWEYRELGMWVEDNLPDGTGILDCGSEWKASFYVSQFSQKDFIPCPEGGFKEFSNQVLSAKPSYLIIEKERVDYTLDPPERAALEAVYENTLPESSPFTLSLAYMNNPRDRKIQNHEIFNALYDGNPGLAASLVRADFSSKKHIYVKLYRIGYD
ncbi:MAG: hypothetical protein COT21_00785 [Hadesarchaea archaeon CG08_land_8_20_14_0_20_51_8]|nr:MAG: hypothetical protein COT21_00785 [Hadesarchaea archaeon CG08_land_8_20_14_0_20_51_8]